MDWTDNNTNERILKYNQALTLSPQYNADVLLRFVNKYCIVDSISSYTYRITPGSCWRLTDVDVDSFPFVCCLVSDNSFERPFRSSLASRSTIPINRTSLSLPFNKLSFDINLILIAWDRS